MTNPNFVTPYAQPLLGGALGLTSEDIAKSLAVSHETFVRDVDQYIDFLIAEGFTAVKRLGLKTSYIFDQTCAKAVMVSWHSPTGASALWGLFTYINELTRVQDLLLEANQKFAQLLEAEENDVSDLIQH